MSAAERREPRADDWPVAQAGPPPRTMPPPIAPLPGAAASPVSSSAARPSIVVHMRTPLMVRVLVVFLLLAVTALTTGLFMARKHGNGWMVEARNLQQVLADNKAALAAADDDLAETQRLLDRSEGDVAELEARLTTLADEKAQAKDEAAAANISAAYLYDLTQAAAAVTTEMGYCIQYQDRWTEVLVDIGRGLVYDSYELDRFIDDMVATCSSAQAKAEYLQQLVESM